MAWLAKESRIIRRVGPKQSFFAHELIGLDEKVAEKMLAFEQDWDHYQKYLQALEGLVTSNTGTDINLTEVPVCLQDEAPSAAPRKKKASAPRSRAKSQSKPASKESSSSTKAK